MGEKLGNEDVPKLGYDVKGGELATFKNDVREDDVEKLAKEYAENKGMMAYVNPDKYDGFIAGWNKCKENTYTEEQLRKVLYTSEFLFIRTSAEEIIQSLKQPK